MALRLRIEGGATFTIPNVRDPSELRSESARTAKQSAKATALEHDQKH